MQFYLEQAQSFDGTQLDDKNLRQQLKQYGLDARRFSRFTQLALLGALPLRAQMNEQTAIYLGSPFNSPSKFDKMFSQLMLHNQPSPLDFMANINNGTTFQLAQAIASQGNSVFLALNQQNYWQPLQLALLDLYLGEAQQALVGWALEHPQQKEGSCFWLISREVKSAVKNLKVFQSLPADGNYLCITGTDFLAPAENQ